MPVLPACLQELSGADVSVAAREGGCPSRRCVVLRGEVPPSAQGELQGAITSLFSITAIIAPLTYTNIFPWFTGPETPVELGGASHVVAGTLLSGARAVLVTKARVPQGKTAAMKAAAKGRFSGPGFRPARPAPARPCARG